MTSHMSAIDIPDLQTQRKEFVVVILYAAILCICYSITELVFEPRRTSLPSGESNEVRKYVCYIRTEC